MTDQTQAPEQDPDRIRFGPGTGQEIPVNLAAVLLEVIWNKNPATFGSHMKEAMIRLWGNPDNGQR
jgi:hypothetical protein